PDAVTIFIMPPSLETLKSRLQSRGTDSPEVIAVRLKNAREEMAQKNLYRHILTNDRLSVPLDCKRDFKVSRDGGIIKMVTPSG
ncbi:MAG: hypothetical protein GY940_36170, partial [bacterium]|nr:hypothetical protein [bacterium]